MKKSILLFAIAASFTLTSSAQMVTTTTTTVEEHWVTTQPALPTITTTVRPPQPSPASIWVEEDWKYNTTTGHYEYSGGHWETPVATGKTKWKKGKWKHEKQGYSWTTGTWY